MLRFRRLVWRQCARLAAKMGCVDCVKLLLKHGADPEALAYGVDTAQSDAQRYGHDEVAELLQDAVKPTDR